MTVATPSPEPIRTNVPARMDALPWSRWHTRVVVALGITWVLDGLEVTLAGAVLGALIFGWATDRFGRKKLFFVTLLLYVAATGASALSWSAGSYFAFRFLTGAGIGGEYAAINSAIDELIPARVRGHVDLLVNATFWIGAAVGSAATIVLLDPAHVSSANGWRYAFGLGAILGLGILFLRNSVPESPRWLMTHGRVDEANAIVDDVEKAANATAMGGSKAQPVEHRETEIYPRDHTPLREVARVMFVEHRTRSMLGLSLMIAQAFFYNAIGFFTLPLILEKFYGVAPGRTSWYLLAFAAGNIAGPIVLGRLFDVVGRKPMIVATYAGSGVLLAITAVLFQQGVLTATTQVVAWTIIFFVASCAASAAYLTVSEIFPLELRGIAISLFYAFGTLVGGVGAPALFGHLIDSGSRERVMVGFFFAALLMLLASVAEAIWGVKAEGKSLEDIAKPLSAKAT